MKYLLIVPDGMADDPVPELGGRTPLMAAATPHLDAIAAEGMVGRVHTIPEGMPPGSDVAALSIMGYDPARVYTGRAPLEAASQGIALGPDDVAFRCNLITVGDGRVVDHSGGEISSEEAAQLIEAIQERLGSDRVRFYPGVSYRNLMVWHGGTTGMETTPPHDILGQAMEPHLPRGEGASLLLQLMRESRDVLADHPVNRKRKAEGKSPANLIWLWGQGRAPRLESFPRLRGVSGAVISAVDLIRGIARLAELNVVLVPGATGRLDTDWAGKRDAARQSLAEVDFVMVHLEAPDECGHKGDLEGKIRAIEWTDREIIGPLWEAARSMGSARMLVLPDHYTPLSLRTHVGKPVPFALAGEGIPRDAAERMDEATGEASPVCVSEGWRLIERLFA